METKFDLKSARVRANLTQREMARKMGMSQTSYLRYEKGELVLRVD
ncbi:MAG: helix-turn-helix domain-containing protein, partial [Leuconostoc mesenteroides]